MTGFVNFIAPRSLLGFVVKLLLIQAFVVIFAVAMVKLIHGDFPFGLRQQVTDTFLMGLPFVAMGLMIVSHQFRLQERLRYMATTDVLTGLRNRRAFFDDAERMLAQRGGGILLLADADHFKSINDTLGHAAGDLCLVAIADRLRSTTGPDDVIARIGGEEFAVFLPAAAPPRVAEVAAALTQGLHVDVLKDGPITLSIGGAVARRGALISDLLRDADRRLYRAKSAGRARAVLQDDGADSAVA